MGLVAVAGDSDPSGDTFGDIHDNSFVHTLQVHNSKLGSRLKLHGDLIKVRWAY